jgi:hypothetical protein
MRFNYLNKTTISILPCSICSCPTETGGCIDENQKFGDEYGCGHAYRFGRRGSRGGSPEMGRDDYMVKHHGYTDRLPQTIEYAIASHRQLVKSESVIIRVLFVEHNLTDVDLTSRHLARYAPFIQLDNVFSGEDALERLPTQLSPSEKCSYDLILMDYRLPE